MSYAKIIGKLILNGAVYATGGAMNGAVGAKILSDGGYTGYSVLEATRVGAAGNAVVGASIGIFKELTSRICCDESNKNKNRKADIAKILGEIALSVGTTTLGGMLGHTMLKQIADMSLEKTAAAMAVGSSTIIGAATALVLVGGCCALIGCGTYVAYSVGASTETIPQAMHNKFGNFFSSGAGNQIETPVGTPPPAPTINV